MDLGLAALIAWLATAGLGSVLVVMWAMRVSARDRYGRPRHGQPPPYIPRRLLIAHVAVASAGLAAWAGALAVHQDGFGWIALGSLLVVAALGVSMFLRWLGSRRARRASRGHGAPVESWLPTAVVLGHGLLGVLTVLLVVLSYLRLGRP